MDFVTKDATDFVQRFISILEDYRDHSDRYVLQIRTNECGQVGVDLVNRIKHQMSRNIFTPDGWTIVKKVRYWVPLPKQTLSAPIVIDTLFRRIVGIPCQQIGAVETLFSLWSLAPEGLRQRAARALQETMTDRIIRVFQQAPLREACKEFCTINAKECSFFKANILVRFPEGIIAPVLWRYLQPQEDQIPVVAEAEMASAIAEGGGDLFYRLRALALGMSSSVRGPLCLFLNPLFPGEMVHQVRYQLHLDDQPMVIQLGTSRILEKEGGLPVVSIEWRVVIRFDQRMCPQTIECILVSAQGKLVTPQLNREIRMYCSCKWERVLHGNIETHFHRPDIAAVMNQMHLQARNFSTTVEGVLLTDTDETDLSSLRQASPRLSSLLRYFTVPLQARNRVFFPRALETYLRGPNVSPQLIGTLVAVSHLPFQEVTRFLEKKYPPNGVAWTHDCSRIEIKCTASGVVVIHHAISSLPGPQGRIVRSIPWSLSITLSQRGDPGRIIFLQNASPLESCVSYLFAPPPHPVPRIAPEPAPSTVRPYLPIPEHGLYFDGQKLPGEAGREAFFSILGKLDPQNQMPTHIDRAAWNRWIESSLHPHAKVLRSLILGFSAVSLFPVVEFLHRVRPPMDGEEWIHEDEVGSITIDGPEKTVLMQRTVRSTCWYSYTDLFQQPQRYPMAEVHCQLSFCYDVNGRVKWGALKALSQKGVDWFRTSQSRVDVSWGSWIFQNGYEVENVFRDPMPLSERIADLSRMGGTLIVNEANYTLLRVFLDGAEIFESSPQDLPLDDKRLLELSGLVVLMKRLGLSSGLQECARNQEAIQRRFTVYVNRRSAWEALMSLLGLPVGASRTSENESIFLQRLRQYDEDQKDLTRRLQKPQLSPQAPDPPSGPESPDEAGTSGSAADRLCSQALELAAKTHEAKGVKRTLSLYEICSAFKEVSLADDESRKQDHPHSLSCRDLPLVTEKERRIEERSKWKAILQELGLQQALEDTELNVNSFLSRWSEHDKERQETDFLFLLALAGGQAVVAPGATLLQKIAWENADGLGRTWYLFEQSRVLSRIFAPFGTEWRHTPGHIDVNIKEDTKEDGKIDGYEITHHQKSDRIERAEPEGAVREVGSLAWSVTMKFDASQRLIETSTSVKEICVPELTPEMVGSLLSLMVSTWSCYPGEETVLPLISPCVPAYQTEYPSSVHHVVRVPMAHSLFALDRMNLSFLHNAAISSLNLNTITPVLHEVETFFAKGLPLHGYHVTQSSICVGREPRLVHRMNSYLYSIVKERAMSRIQVHTCVSWNIEILLNELGEPLSVRASDLPDALHAKVVPLLENLLRMKGSFEPMTRSVVVTSKWA